MSIVGQPLSRVEGRLKVTGMARYTAEIALPNLVHAVVVQSTIARGRIVQMDTQAAEAAPGVLAVLTHRNAQKLYPAEEALMYHDRDRMRGDAGESFLPLQDEIVYYNGQHIAVVIAETLEQATYAASLVRTGYESEQPVETMEAALPYAFAPKNVWGDPPDTLHGNTEQGLAEADVCVDQTYMTALQNHTTMETHVTIAVWEGEKLTLYEPSTWVYGVRTTVSSWFHMPEENIRVIQHFVGGSFGCKGPVWPHVALAAMAAKQVGRPVELVLTRQQEFTSTGYRPQILHHMQLGAKQDGRLTAVVHGATAQTAPYEVDDRVVAPVTRTTRKLYACPNIATTYRLVRWNMGGPFTMRGPAETPGLFALESAMDELAYALNMDPLELRLRNYAECDPEDGRPWSSKALRECYRQGAERFGWDKRDPRPRSMHHGDYLVGMGMATMAISGPRPAPASASALLFADGSALIRSATCDQGTGTYTIMAQIAASALGLPMDRVRFELGDTQMPSAPISAGSMTASSVGSAVEMVATALRRKVLAMAFSQPASPLYGLNEADVLVENGRCYLKAVPSIGQTYAEILELGNQYVVEVMENVKPREEAENYTCYAFGAQFAEVHVHASTGEVRVNRYVGAFDSGRILNPKTAHSQLTGGIVMGIGMALMEGVALDARSGRILNANLAQYAVPVNADIPEIDAFFVEDHDPHVNLIGVKIVGESGTVGSAAAIANAVYHATGKRIRDLPITPDKLL